MNNLPKILNLEGYAQLLSDIKSILQRGLSKAYKAVDNLKVQTYWQIGERIVREELQHTDRADYGKRVVENLTTDLNLSRSILFYIVEFYRVYPIVHTLYGQLSWSHYRLLITIKNKEKRQFYENSSIRNGWSVRELKEKIKKQEYENAKKKGPITVKQPPQLPAPEDVFKDSYNWDFLELEKNHSENELEQALIKDVEKVLLEFGSGFAFMGSQQKILISGQYHKIDLIFYHRLLRCIILVELKTERFKPEFIGQLNKYLTYFRENETQEFERDPIGLLICKEKDEQEVHYALGKLKEDIFVAEYRAYLPSENEIKEKLKN